jgi:DNA-binding transcriptional ArsR family regulator
MYYRLQSMTCPDIVFKAIAHPARRQIITLLSRSNCSVKELTRSFAISQPAVSQHLRELREANLVTSEKVGLEQRYKLTVEPIRLVFEWSSQYKRFFDPSGHAWSFVPAQKSSPRNPSRRKIRNGG